jgi:hypothetical protein
MISLFTYSKLIKKIPEHLSFNDFCRQVENGIPPIGLYNNSGLSQCNPQVRWVENINIDFIGRFENFDTDAKTILKKINKNPDLILPHKNKSIRKQTQDYYDNETIDIVKHIYAEDFKYFGYRDNL